MAGSASAPAPETLIALLNITAWQVDVEKNARSWLSPIPSQYSVGGNYFDNRRPEVTAKRLLKRLVQSGFQVEVRQAHTSLT
jgi:hypothetical protein